MKGQNGRVAQNGHVTLFWKKWLNRTTSSVRKVSKCRFGRQFKHIPVCQKNFLITFLKFLPFYLSFQRNKPALLTSPSGRNYIWKQKVGNAVSFCHIFLACCCEICWGNIFCSSNYSKGQQSRGCSKLNVLSKPSMSIPSVPQVHTKY